VLLRTVVSDQLTTDFSDGPSIHITVLSTYCVSVVCNVCRVILDLCLDVRVNVW